VTSGEWFAGHADGNGILSKSAARIAGLTPPPAPRGAEPNAAQPAPRTRQQTLASAISARGIGLHSGLPIRLHLAPAPAGHGIVFRRTDTGIAIPARHDHVRDTRQCTVIGLDDTPQARVGTIEHLMAALAAAGIDNALVSLDGPEVPAFDGSAAEFSFLIASAGIAVQDAPLSVIEVLRPVRVAEGEATAALLPAQPRGGALLTLSMEIDFGAAAIGHQERTLALTSDAFATEIARARTFGFAEDFQRLRSNGLALGGGLHNAIALSGGRVLNKEGLRFADEFVRHKLLDAVGDLALAGLPIRGRFVGHRSGHRLNNLALRALLAEPAAFRIVPAASRPAARPTPVAAPDRRAVPELAAAAA
jgi:UDP-3-O-[3-hydroxymyristoyl] N-acetylglucosamine deacetylase